MGNSRVRRRTATRDSEQSRSTSTVRRSMRVGPADDVYEREADTMAAEVVRRLAGGTDADRDRGAALDLAALGTVQAQNNIFGTLGGEGSVFDVADEASRADIVTTGALTGNAAFVQGLFVRFLRRPADPAALVGFSVFLRDEHSNAELAAQILGSDEYFRQI